jgi:glycine cleavage system pyridoxal-binding protein P
MNTSTPSLTTPGLSPNDFAYRHLGLTDTDRRHMLDTIGATSVEELLAQTIPQSIRLTDALSVPHAVAEHEVLTVLKEKFTDWTGLLQHNYSSSIATQHDRKPCVVHRIHPLSTRN